MATLFLLDERTAQSWQVWPLPETIPQGAVRELGSYLFELRHCDTADATDLLLDDLPLEALRSRTPDSARWRWEPGFHAGVVQAELKIPGHAARRFEVVTDPDLRKLTRDHFDTMVREIIEDTFALFSLSSFRKAVARGNGNRPPAIARLEFLRSRIEELERVVTTILRNPRRRLTAEEQVVPYHRASHATGPEILRSLRSGKILQETAPARLPPSLQGFLPAAIRVRRKLNSPDLPEHRQIGACLRSWSAWLSVAAEQLERACRTGDSERQQSSVIWANRCRQLARRIGRLAGNPTFNESDTTVPQLRLSAVFRNDPVYRRFYRLWQDINRGIAAVFGEFLDMPLARTWELYELWCFLRLVRAAADEFGPEGMDVSELFTSDAAGGVTLAARSVTVPAGVGWKLCFQKQYREFWIEPDGCGSYTRTMTPDIVAAWESPGGQDGPDHLIVLDAKYRIDEGLNDAIGSIHTYRDALVREMADGDINGIVSAAYLLTPHIALQPADGNYRQSKMPGRLFRPDYQSEFRFGAVTLKPGMSFADIAITLKRMVNDARAFR